MNITDVKIYKQDRDKLKAYASVTLEGVFVITGIKIMEGSKGLFVAMPSQKNKKTEKYDDICYPCTKEFREQLNKAVLEKYGVSGEGNRFIPAEGEDQDSLPF